MANYLRYRWDYFSKIPLYACPLLNLVHCIDLQDCSMVFHFMIVREVGIIKQFPLLPPLYKKNLVLPGLLQITELFWNYH